MLQVPQMKFSETKRTLKSEESEVPTHVRFRPSVTPHSTLERVGGCVFLGEVLRFRAVRRVFCVYRGPKRKKRPPFSGGLFLAFVKITQRGRQSTCARSAPEPCWSSRSREVAVPATSGERKETTKDFFVLDLSEVELLSFPLGDRAKCLTVLGLFQ